MFAGLLGHYGYKINDSNYNLKVDLANKLVDDYNGMVGSLKTEREQFDFQIETFNKINTLFSDLQENWDKSNKELPMNNILNDLQIEINKAKEWEKNSISSGYFEGVITNQALISGLESAVQIVKKHCS